MPVACPEMQRTRAVGAGCSVDRLHMHVDQTELRSRSTRTLQACAAVQQRHSGSLPRSCPGTRQRGQLQGPQPACPCTCVRSMYVFIRKFVAKQMNCLANKCIPYVQTAMSSLRYRPKPGNKHKTYSRFSD
eukprot:scaffold183232_cov20-Tisochrysis_lutea.AAC.1